MSGLTSKLFHLGTSTNSVCIILYVGLRKSTMSEIMKITLDYRNYTSNGPGPGFSDHYLMRNL